jgi:hypothetical protein
MKRNCGDGSGSFLGDVLTAGLITLLAEVERTLNRAPDQRLRSSVGVSFVQSKMVVCLVRQGFATQLQLASYLDYGFGALSRLISRGWAWVLRRGPQTLETDPVGSCH